MREVEETLKRIGSGKIENPGLFGSFVFVGYTGTKQVLWTDQVACSATKGPAELTGFIITPAAEAELGIEEESETQSEYDLIPNKGDRFSESETFVSPTLQSARVSANKWNTVDFGVYGTGSVLFDSYLWLCVIDGREQLNTIFRERKYRHCFYWEILAWLTRYL